MHPKCCAISTNGGRTASVACRTIFISVSEFKLGRLSHAEHFSNPCARLRLVKTQTTRASLQNVIESVPLYVLLVDLDSRGVPHGHRRPTGIVKPRTHPEIARRLARRILPAPIRSRE